MRLIVSDNTDVYFHLAAEDYLLRHTDEEVIMLWRSKKAAVCGKHQNICSEINIGWCLENGIQPARRLSGGGTVFHDSGNVNFTFISKIHDMEKAIDFKQFLEPIRKALAALNITAEYSGRNDLLLNGLKISGNAEHVFQKERKVLHHGTLLFDSDLENLGLALRSNGEYIGKSVQSVRSKVTNIKPFLTKPMEVESFIAHLADFLEKEKHTNRYVFCDLDVENIEKLRKDKYFSESWFLGYSPKYRVKKSIFHSNTDYHFEMQVEKGRITEVVMTKDGVHFDLNGFAGEELTVGTAVSMSKAIFEDNFSESVQYWVL